MTVKTSGRLIRLFSRASLPISVLCLIFAFEVFALSEGVGPGTNGWIQAGDGTWSYYTNGNMAKDAWIYDGGHWYYTDGSGTMLTGRQTVHNMQVYLSETSSELYPQGACYINTVAPDGQVSGFIQSVAMLHKANRTEAEAASSDMLRVDVAAQKATLYIGGQPVWESPCVTGCVATGRSTPCGTFSITSMTRGTYLTGPTWKNWVDYWMPFYDGCGFHDANWRKNFGGDIYLYSGSHGCVNLPPEKAAELYGLVYTGLAVVIE